MKKFLFISHRADRSGAPVLLRNLLLLLKAETDFNLRVLIKEDGVLTKAFEAVAPTAVLVRPPFFLRKLWLWAVKLGLRLTLHRYDAVLSNTITNGNLHRIIGQHPCILTYVHELPFVIEKATGEKELARMLKHTRLFLSPSDAVSRNLQTAYGISPQRIKFLPYYVPDRLFQKAILRERFLKAAAFDAADFVVGGMGTVGFRKGTDLFLETAHRALAADGSVRFVWCGGNAASEEWETFITAIARQGLQSKVLLLPETEEPMAVMAGFDVFFLSSREDPYPLVMLEAAMMQVPVVYFAGTGGAGEFIGQSAGFGVAAFSTEEACSRILRLRNDKALCEQRAAQGRQNYLRLHTKEPVLTAFREAVARAAAFRGKGSKPQNFSTR